MTGTVVCDMAVFPPDTLSFDDISRLATEMDNMNIPQKGRVVIVAPDVARKLQALGRDQSQFYQPAPEAGLLPHYLGQYEGMAIKIDKTLPSGTVLEAHTPLYVDKTHGKT